MALLRTHLYSKSNPPTVHIFTSSSKPGLHMTGSVTSLYPNPGNTCSHLAPSFTWPPFSVRKTYLTLGSGKVADDWMLAIATLVGSSPVATAPEFKEQGRL